MGALLTRGKNRRRKQAAAGGTGLVGGALAAGGAFLLLTRRGRALLFGKTKAAVNAVTPSPPRDYDDVTLARKVETEIFRDADAPKGDVDVNVEHGVVFLRGQVKNVEQMKELEAAARKVDGVQEVDNLLHLPKTEPLTKTEGKVRSVATR
ncbi:MAG: BON domain-containing protein [Thermoleophilaceae bacterium]